MGRSSAFRAGGDAFGARFARDAICESPCIVAAVIARRVAPDRRPQVNVARTRQRTDCRAAEPADQCALAGRAGYRADDGARAGTEQTARQRAIGLRRAARGDQHGQSQHGHKSFRLPAHYAGHDHRLGWAAITKRGQEMKVPPSRNSKRLGHAT